MTDIQIDPASYKDPAGFIFTHEANVYRHVHTSYANEYDLLMQSGLYSSLTQKKWLIQHQEIHQNLSGSTDFYKTLLPWQLPFISYPYEWSFDMLKDAALLTLWICQEAIRFGMVLKDATAFNVQFVNSRPLFIDTLSFEKYDASRPWVAYRQFCEMFLSPLLLTHYAGTDMNKLLLAYSEGIPVPVCSRLLPFKSRFNLLSLLHIHLQSSVRTDAKTSTHPHSFSRQKLLNILQHLTRGISALTAGTAKSTWSDYYSNTIKSQEYLTEKELVFRKILKQIPVVGTAIDIGANNGFFSKMLADRNWKVIASDFDNHAVNDLYIQLKKEPDTSILPLAIDISNPSPAIGWENTERKAFLKRGCYDLVVALALVHHLAIGKNISFKQIATCLNVMCTQYLIIEYVERQDEKVKVLLERKELTYDKYIKEEFEKQFSVYFAIVTSSSLSNGLRTIYLWKKH